MFSTGNLVNLLVSDPATVRDLCLNTSLALGKPYYWKTYFGALLGEGVAAASAHSWATQRKIIAAEFFANKVKGMVDLMVKSALPLLTSLEDKINQEAGVTEIAIERHVNVYAADVISRACFGSNFYEGKEIFSKINAIIDAMANWISVLGIPGFRYLPTKGNREIWRLDTDVCSLITKLIKERRGGGNSKNDMLLSIIENANNENVPKSFVIDSCKNIYFAGQETTSTTVQWVLVLLASHQEWQQRVREEAMEICRGRMPDAEMLQRMTLLTMVIQETLRLYPATPTVFRQVHQSMKLGKLWIPKGTILWIPILHFSHDSDLWGPDVGEFNPSRFEQGVSGACRHSHMFLSFGIGVRTCLGQNFAMAEMKVVLSLILCKFKFSLSPNYRHSVAHRLVLSPANGVQLLVENLEMVK